MPFSPEELLARVIALVGRSYPERVTFTPTIKLDELEIDILNRTVRAGSAPLHMTSLEQSLLYLLAANAGRVVTCEEILDTLWGVDYVADSNVVDRQIRNLRARLRHDPRQPHYLATVPGRGYCFLPPPSPDGALETALQDFEDHVGSPRNSPSTHEPSRRERARRHTATLPSQPRKDPSLQPRG
jgi:DNA-binding winged helix-turn-helix (wHTH) protein